MGAYGSGCCACDSSATLNIYVSGVNGNDNNSGYTPATPLATFAEAVERAEGHLGLVIIHFGLHGGAGYTPVTIRNVAREANYWLIGDGAGQAGEDGFVVQLATEAALAGSSTTQVLSTSVLVADTYRGMTIEILTGAATGNRRTIRNNSTTAIFPVVPFSAAIAAGDTFRVVDPSVIINFPASTGADLLLVGGSGMNSTAEVTGTGVTTAVGFANMRFTGPSSAAAYVIAASRVVFYGVVSTTVASNASIPVAEWQAGSTIGMGIDCTNLGSFALAAQMPFIDFALPSRTSWHGWSFAQRGAQTSALSIRGECMGSYVGAAMQVSIPGDLYLNGGNLYGGNSSGALSCTNGGRARLQAVSTTLPILLTSSLNAAVYVTRQAEIFTLLGATLTGTGVPALRVDSGGRIGVFGSVTGSGTFGTVVYAGSQAIFNGAPTLTGSTADLSVDPIGGTGVPNATLAASNDAIGASNGALIARI